MTMETLIKTADKLNADIGRSVFKLGLDVHLQWIVAVVQEGHQNPKAPRKFTRAQLVAWVEEQVQKGHEVWTVQESCGFGFVVLPT